MSKFLQRPSDPIAKLAIGGVFTFEAWDKDGNLKFRKELKNGFTNEGLNHDLDVLGHGGTQVSPWYIGLIDLSGFTALAAGDTLVSHTGWTEATAYTGDRKAWDEAAPSAQSMGTANASSFAINASLSLKGAFLASVATGTSGILLCTAAFTGGDREGLQDGDTLNVSYTLSMSAL